MADETLSTTTTTPVVPTGATSPATGTMAGDLASANDATATPTSGASTRADLKTAANTAVDRVKEEAARGKEQAYAAAATYADTGKGKAAGALTTLSGLIVEAAKMLEENFGHRAADPVRAQADKVSGAARHLETADVDQLTNELKVFAKNNPVLSVGAVAVVGFALGKLLSGGGHHDD